MEKTAQLTIDISGLVVWEVRVPLGKNVFVADVRDVNALDGAEAQPSAMESSQPTAHAGGSTAFVLTPFGAAIQRAHEAAQQKVAVERDGRRPLATWEQVAARRNLPELTQVLVAVLVVADTDVWSSPAR